MACLKSSKALTCSGVHTGCWLSFLLVMAYSGEAHDAMIFYITSIKPRGPQKGPDTSFGLLVADSSKEPLLACGCISFDPITCQRNWSCGIANKLNVRAPLALLKKVIAHMFMFQWEIKHTCICCSLCYIICKKKGLWVHAIITLSSPGVRWVSSSWVNLRLDVDRWGAPRRCLSRSLCRWCILWRLVGFPIILVISLSLIVAGAILDSERHFLVVPFAPW